MLRLFLENIEVELNEKIQFALTKQFEDITSPADIKNDYSKTVKIPFSAHNNKLFGNLFSTDRLIVEGDNTLMGVHFNPYKKVDFRLQYGDEVLMVGYAKNISVERVNEREGYYNITLNGELGKVFQEMKKITFDNTTDDKKYLIDGSKYVKSIINKDLIYELWNNEPDLDRLDLVENTDSNYRIQDYIGFIPNNSYDDDFDYKTFQLNNQNASKTFAEVLDEKARTVGNQKDDNNDGTVDNDDDNYQTVVGIAAETVIGEGLLPREIGEYRSYLQIPYIYFNKLFQIFAKKTTEITGYEVVKDASWFNKTNPYWSKLVYILEKFDISQDLTDGEGEVEELNLNSFLLNLNSSGHIQLAPSTYVPSIQSQIATTFSTPVIEEIRTKFKNEEANVITVKQQDLALRLTIRNPYSVTEEYVGTATDKIIYNSDSLFAINFRLIDSNGNVVSECKNALVTEDNPFGAARFEGVNKIIVDNNQFKWIADKTWVYDFRVDFQFAVDKSKVGDDFYIDCVVYQESNNPYLFYLNSVAQANRIAPQTISFEIIGDNENFTYYGYGILNRSFSPFDLNELWNNEFNPFDEILNYCKQFRIGVFCDYVNKKLIFKPLSTYFSDYKVLDWTDKVDYSKAYNIQPITFENKYVLFNYEKYETELNKQYNEKYGRNYGEYRLTTDYEFNTEEKELFKFSKVTIPSTDICLSWTNLYDNLSIIYTLPAEITAYNKDEDKKNVNVFGSMLFYKGLTDFDSTSAMRPVNITDDSDFQMFNQTYFYTQNGQDGRNIRTYKYPVLDIVYNENLCTFAIPSQNYTYLPNSYDNTNGIYKNFWENYLNERYNKQNKIVTCYLRLTPQDFAQFEYNNFVKIQNQLYMVNKIYDYQIDENALTKVDLITIQDIKGYTKAVTFEMFEMYNSKGQEWSYYRDYITLTKVGQTQTIYVTSSKPVTWIDESGALQDLLIYYNNDKSNGVNGTTGTIPSGEFIPITFEMLDNEDQFGDIIFTSGDKEYRVSVALIRDESFSIYDSDKSLWTSTDKIELQNTNPLQKTIYITSPNTDVQWSVNDNTLQDLYINGQAGSGVIPSGTLIPVTFVMDKEGDVGAISSSVRFYTNKQTTDVNVKIYYNEIFKIYHWNGDLWDEQYGYIDLSPNNPKQVIYLDANSDVEWVYVDNNGNPSADLQGLGICPNEDGDWDWGSYDWSGRGMIYPPSNYRPIYFGMDSSIVQGRSEGRVEFYNGRHSWYVDVVLRDN